MGCTGEFLDRKKKPAGFHVGKKKECIKRAKRATLATPQITNFCSRQW
jgi:hypothetical protein